MFDHLTEDCLDRWMQDFDTFRVEFLQQCFFLTKAVGYYFDFDQSKLKAAHDSWRSTCELWEKSYVMPDSTGLSHLKIMAILLVQLAKVEWVRNVYEFDSGSEERKFEFAGTAEEREEVRRDFNSGRGTYLAFQFALQVLNWFEQARDDRLQPFEDRLTTDLEYDLMVYLLSERRDEMATFLIFKALYARDAKEE